VNISSKHQEFETLKERVEQLEAELREVEASRPWQPVGAYAAYDATAGFVLGGLAAVSALLVNVIGAPIAGKQSLELIRVYLTFPLGEQALLLAEPGRGGQAIGDGMILAFGCCLFLFTGMLLGIPMQVGLARFIGQSSLPKRLLIGGAMGLALWILDFYLVLSWLEPLLFGGNWIINPRYLPPWVAAGTHFVFGLTMAALYPLAEFVRSRYSGDKT
jgi:hypothetical protein